MAKTKLERVKPHVDIGTTGHVDHGKTTTTTAITKVLADKFPDLSELFAYGAIDKAPEEKERGTTINISHIEYQAERRHYTHADAPDRANYIKSMVTGTAQMNGAILVVTVTDSPVPWTRERVLLARRVGVPYIPVTLNKCDMVDDEKIIEFVKMKVHELLAEQDYDEGASIVHISALKALEGEKKWVNSILELMEACDENTPDPVRETDKLFLIPIEDIFTITGRGAVAAGRVERGVLNVNNEIEILGIKEKSQRTTVTGIEIFRKPPNSAEAGDNCGLLLHGTKRKNIKRGQIVAKPGAYAPHTEFEGSVYVLSKDEGDRHTPFFNNYRPQFYFRTADATDIVSLPESVEMVMPGDNVDTSVKLIQSVAMDEGLRFTIREGGHTVGAGHVAKITK